LLNALSIDCNVGSILILYIQPSLADFDPSSAKDELRDLARIFEDIGDALTYKLHFYTGNIDDVIIKLSGMENTEHFYTLRAQMTAEYSTHCHSKLFFYQMVNKLKDIIF